MSNQYDHAENTMKYDGVVVLIMTATILYSAVNLEVQTVDLHMICLLLLVAGVGLAQHRCC